MISGQFLAIVKMFGGLQKTPKWLDVTIGIMLIFMFISLWSYATR